MKVLLLEINEVPQKLILKFQDQYPSLKKFIHKAQFCETKCQDHGELSPWITWPSFHRGMNNTEHGIKHLGQDPETFKGRPIWEEVRKQGKTIGIFGSLQSWPPSDPGEGGFFIPDTFAYDESTIPESLSEIQKFNLDQVKNNARVIARQSFLKLDKVKLVFKMVQLGLTFKTIARLVGQLVLEKIDKRYLARRPIFQTIIFFDLFKKIYKVQSPPDFSTFFTNHVASIQHRFWNTIFPETFSEKLQPKNFFHLSTVKFSLKVLDEIMAYAMWACEKNDKLCIVMASSMGQDTILREAHEGFEAVLKHPEKLLQKLGLTSSDFKLLPAMVPQITIEFYDKEKLQKVFQQLNQFKTQNGFSFFEADINGKTITLTTKTPSQEESKKQIYDAYGKLCNWENLGVEFLAVEPGTAYHIPEGIMYVYQSPKHHPQKLELAKVKSELLQLIEL